MKMSTARLLSVIETFPNKAAFSQGQERYQKMYGWTVNHNGEHQTQDIWSSVNLHGLEGSSHVPPSNSILYFTRASNTFS